MTDTTAQPIEEHNKFQTNQELINYHIEQITGRANLTSQIKVFKELTGNATLAQMLIQLIYWSDRSSRVDGFIYKSAVDWEYEVGASRYLVRIFNDLPFIITKVQKANRYPTTHYKVDFAKLIPALYNRNSQTKSKNAIKPQSAPIPPAAAMPIEAPSIPNPADPTPIQDSSTPSPKPKYRYPKMRNRDKITPVNVSPNVDNRAKMPPTEPSSSPDGGKITPIKEAHITGNGEKMPPIKPSSPPDGGKITPSDDLQQPSMGAKIPLSEPSPTPDGGKNALSMGQNQPGIGAKLPQYGGKIDKSLTLNTTINTSNNTNNKLKDKETNLKEKESFPQPCSNSSFGNIRLSQVFADQNPDLLKALADSTPDPPPDPATAKSPAPKANYQEFLAELADVTGFNLSIKPNAERLNRVASQLVSAGYSVDDLKNFFNHWIEKDWRWKKSGSLPTPENVLSDIAQVKKLQDMACYERQKYLRWLH